MAPLCKPRVNFMRLCASKFVPLSSKMKQQVSTTMDLTSFTMIPCIPPVLLLISSTTPLQSKVTTILEMLRSRARDNSSWHAIASRTVGSFTPVRKSAHDPMYFLVESLHIADDEPPGDVLNTAPSTHILAIPGGCGSCLVGTCAC